MAGRTRSGSGTYGRLMLFAALLFGIVAMHTVGHPAEHGEPSSASLVMGPAAIGPAAIDPAAIGLGAVDPAAPDAHHAPHDSPAPDSPDAPATPMNGMDPLAVCLAVLGVWGLALVGVRLFGPRADGRPLGTPAGAGIAWVARPNPPPRISVLASVSVLRI